MSSQKIERHPFHLTYYKKKNNNKKNKKYIYMTPTVVGINQRQINSFKDEIITF